MPPTRDASPKRIGPMRTYPPATRTAAVPVPSPVAIALQVPQNQRTTQKNRAEAELTPFSGIGFVFLVLFVFVSTSRVFDFGLASLHIPLIFSVLAAAFTFLGGAPRIAFATRTGKMVGLFALWMVVCIPFSRWRGGSFDVLTTLYYKSFLVFVMVAGATTTLGRVRKLMITIGVGSLIAMIIANLIQTRVDGRLSLPLGFLANPNDLAQMMVVGMCFFMAVGVGKSAIWKIFPAICALPFLYTIFDTGSRAAVLAVLLLGCILFLYAPAMQKMGILVLFVTLTVAMFSVSKTAGMRLKTLFAEDLQNGASASEEIAVASKEGRLEALLQSLELTIKNPVFGVGPGAFQSVAAELSHADKKSAAWIETHNSYTQVSSEMGIPGLIFFGGAIVSCLIGLYKARKRVGLSDTLARGTLNCLVAGFIGFAFMSIFVSIAYQFYISLLIGLSSATIRIMERDFPISTAPVKAVASSPWAAPANQQQPQNWAQK